MSFDKKFPKSKDARKRCHKYHDSRDFDRTCRCHGSCAYCASKRTHGAARKAESAKAHLKEWES